MYWLGTNWWGLIWYWKSWSSPSHGYEVLPCYLITLLVPIWKVFDVLWLHRATFRRKLCECDTTQYRYYTCTSFIRLPLLAYGCHPEGALIRMDVSSPRCLGIEHRLACEPGVAVNWRSMTSECTSMPTRISQYVSSAWKSTVPLVLLCTTHLTEAWPSLTMPWPLLLPTVPPRLGWRIRIGRTKKFLWRSLVR